MNKAPLNDSILIAVARLVDDAQTETREPSHSDIGFQFQRLGLNKADPKAQGQLVGKAKRVRGVLSWALENDIQAGESLVANLISIIRGFGGFRLGSLNYVGTEAIENASQAFRSEGFEFSSDGELRPLILDNLTGTALTSALKSYVRRAKRGVQDAALLTGTGKDLLEATAAHVVKTKFGSYSKGSNFPTLLGQAFVTLSLATPQDAPQQGEPAEKKFERAMYETACAINHLRNKEGTGHGRPWVSNISESEARAATEMMGIVAEFLLDALAKSK